MFCSGAKITESQNWLLVMNNFIKLSGELLQCNIIVYTIYFNGGQKIQNNKSIQFCCSPIYPSAFNYYIYKNIQKSQFYLFAINFSGIIKRSKYGEKTTGYISNSLIESESLQRETVGFFAAPLIIDQFANFMIEINAIELKISCIFRIKKKQLIIVLATDVRLLLFSIKRAVSIH